MTTHRPAGSVLEVIKRLAARPDGVTMADITARFGDAPNGSRLRKAGSAGHIYPGRRQNLKATHWFDTAERAKAWEASGLRAQSVELTAVVPTKSQRLSLRGGRYDHPVVHIKGRAVGANAPGEPILTPKTRRTIDTTQRPTARWQMLADLPRDERWPSFAATPLGVNPDTGRPWA